MRAVAAALVAGLALAIAGCGGDVTRTETIELPGGGGGSAEDGAGRGGADLVGIDDCDDAELQPDEDNLERVEAAALCLVEAERSDRGLAGLRRRDDLTDAARAKSQDMVDQRYFEHVGPDGRDVRDWADDAGYLPGGGGGFRVGENLGWGSDGAADPATLVQGWMDSPSHRENILREGYEDTGMGVVLGEPGERGLGGATYTQMFGSR